MKVSTSFVVSIIAALFFACAPQEAKIMDLVKGPFMGMKPGESPVLLAPSLLASPLEEYNGTFSPDGLHFFYTMDTPSGGFLVETHMQGDSSWTKARISSFSGQYSDYDPLYSYDGSRLYFSSTRPVQDSLSEGISHIWYVDRMESGWGTPKHVELTGEGDYYSSTTRNGLMYFNVWSTGNLFRAKETASGWESEKLLGALDFQTDAGDPFISPEEDYLLFRSYLPDGYGRGDLYISFQENGNWTRPMNLGEPINSAAHEMCPLVTQDGRWFIFASSRLSAEYAGTPEGGVEHLIQKSQSYDNGELNIYYMSADFIEDLRKKAVPHQ